MNAPWLKTAIAANARMRRGAFLRSPVPVTFAHAPILEDLADMRAWLFGGDVGAGPEARIATSA